MQTRTVTVNGQTLTDAEAGTLRMILAMVTMDLRELDLKRPLEGITVSEHLQNIGKLTRLVGEEQPLDD